MDSWIVYNSDKIACISETEEGKGRVFAIDRSDERTTIDVSRKEGAVDIFLIDEKFLFLLWPRSKLPSFRKSSPRRNEVYPDEYMVDPLNTFWLNESRIQYSES